MQISIAETQNLARRRWTNYTPSTAELQEQDTNQKIKWQKEFHTSIETEL